MLSNSSGMRDGVCYVKFVKLNFIVCKKFLWFFGKNSMCDVCIDFDCFIW